MGDFGRANTIFNRFVEFGEKHLHNDVKIDYFAVSLPDMLVFDVDLNLRNVIFCNYLIGLGHLGLGDIEKGKNELQKVLTMDINHQGAAVHLEMVDYFSQLNQSYIGE